MFGNCRKSGLASGMLRFPTFVYWVQSLIESTADLTFPEGGKTISIKIPRDSAAHSKKVQREREEVSSFFPSQTNPSTMLSASNDTLMLKCQEATDKSSEHAKRPRRPSTIDVIEGGHSPSIAKSSRHGSFYDLIPTEATSEQCSPRGPVDVRSCCSNA